MRGVSGVKSHKVIKCDYIYFYGWDWNWGSKSVVASSALTDCSNDSQVVSAVQPIASYLPAGKTTPPHCQTRQTGEINQWLAPALKLTLATSECSDRLLSREMIKPLLWFPLSAGIHYAGGETRERRVLFFCHCLLSISRGMLT